MRKAIKEHGFTLLEVLISVALLSGLTAIAIPLLQGYAVASERNALNTLFKDIITESRFRAKANDQTLTICPLGENRSCVKNWAKGNIAIFKDSDDDKIWDINETLFKRYSFTSQHHKIRFNRGSGKYLKTKRNGYFNFFGSFIFCELHADEGNKLIISTSGRVRYTPVDHDDCNF